MRGSQEVALCFLTMLYRTNSRLVSKDEKPGWTSVDAILFCAIDQQGVVRRGAAEPVPRCYVPRVAARAAVTEDFLTTHSQNEAEFVIVGMAAFAEDSIRNSEEQQFRRPVSQDADPRGRKNIDRAGRGMVDLGFGIGDSGHVGETVPRGIVAGVGALAEKSLPPPGQVGNPQRIPLYNRAVDHLLEGVNQQFGAACVHVPQLR